MARSTATLLPPVVSAPDLPDALTPQQVRRGADLLAGTISLTDVTEAAHSSLEQCRVDGTATTLDLRGATLMDVEFDDVRAADVQARDANLRRVRITGGRFGTLDLTDTRIDELEIIGARIDYLTLAGTKATNVRIDDCHIVALDLPQATLTRCAVTGTRTREVDPRGLKASHVDLRGLDADSYLDVTGLRGTTLSSLQVQMLAPVFAAIAGITVLD